MNPLTLARAVEARQVVSSSTSAAVKQFGAPNEVDAEAVAPALYSVNVHVRSSGELVGKYGVFSGVLASDRLLALDLAARETGLAIAELQTREEWI